MALEFAGSAISVPLMRRYTRADLAVFSEEESRRFLDTAAADLQLSPSLAWELLYRIEPELYDRLAQAERLHPAVLAWFPDHVGRIVEVGAGAGRLTLELITHCDDLTAIEPAAPLRELLRRKLPATASNIRLVGGFFDALPVADRSADLVAACSALTPEPAHGGDRGLAEMERVCAHAGVVVIVWPNHVEWLIGQGYRYLSFPGDMTVDFATLDEAVELARIFYPAVASEVQRRGERRVPYQLLGVNPPRDLAYKVIA